MNATWLDDDDRLAGELAAALRAGTRPSPDRVAMVMAGYDIVMADAVEAELVFDSAVDELAAVRSDEAGARMLTYAEAADDTDDTGDDGGGDPEGAGSAPDADADVSAGRVEIDFEIVDGRVVGHVDPPSGGIVRLEQPTLDGPGVSEVAPDDLGSFEHELRSPATFRLRYVDADGRSVVTGWLAGPHALR